MANQIVIRKMKIEDYDELFKLWTSTEGIGLRSLDDSRESIAAFLRRNPETNFVAVDESEGGALAGNIMCGHDGRKGHIYHTVVRKDCQGRGIGSRLVDAAVQALQKEGIARVGLNVMTTNEKGRRFWESQGWKEKSGFSTPYSRSITERENKPLI